MPNYRPTRFSYVLPKSQPNQLTSEVRKVTSDKNKLETYPKPELNKTTPSPMESTPIRGVADYKERGTQSSATRKIIK